MTLAGKLPDGARWQPKALLSSATSKGRLSTMQALRIRRLPCAVRQYSTGLPDGALVARTVSTPMAIKLRRRKKLGAIVARRETDANEHGLTLSEVQRYNRLRVTGQIPKVDGEPLAPAEWIRRANERRTRLRGFQKVKEADGKEVIRAVGPRVYLPNIIFKLVRNHTVNGEPYNPYEASFRIPKSVTKTDIRSYLEAVYGVKTTYIRTDNYNTPAPKRGRRPEAHRSYKRAVVGLVDPFYYPHRMEDMSAEQKKEREAWIENEFATTKVNQDRKAEILRMTIGHGAAAFRFRPENETRRSRILKLVLEKKLAREQLVDQHAQEIREKRKQGGPVNYEVLAAKLSTPTTEASSSP
jgi:large subunit ribosomal protein L23